MFIKNLLQVVKFHVKLQRAAVQAVIHVVEMEGQVYVPLIRSAAELIRTIKAEIDASGIQEESDGMEKDVAAMKLPWSEEMKIAIVELKSAVNDFKGKTPPSAGSTLQ